MLSAELKEIERLTVKNNGYESFDTWGNSTRSMLYFYLINEFREKGYNMLKGDKGDYFVYFRHGSDGVGMYMGSPDTMIVTRVNEYPKKY